MSIQRGDIKIVFAVALIIGGFVLALATGLDLNDIRIAVAALAVATGIALIL